MPEDKDEDTKRPPTPDDVPDEVNTPIQDPKIHPEKKIITKK